MADKSSERLSVTVDIANLDAVTEILAAMRAALGVTKPFIKAFVETGYSYWTGAEYRCPHCSAGRKQFNREDVWLSDPKMHDKDCAWRSAYAWYHADIKEE